MPVILWLWSLSAKSKLIILGLILAAAAVAYVGYLSNKASKAQREAKAAQQEQDRLKRQNEGLNILQNTNSIAAEIENDKKLANQQAINSNASNADFTNSVRRDSNSFSGSYTDSKSRFCKNFPQDSRCGR